MRSISLPAYCAACQYSSACQKPLSFHETMTKSCAMSASLLIFLFPAWPCRTARAAELCVCSTERPAHLCQRLAIR